MSDPIPVIIDMNTRRGDTFVRNFAIGADLDGCSLHMQVRRTANESKVYADVHSGNGITVVGFDPVANVTTVSMTISNAITSNFAVGALAYDCELIRADGTVQTIFQGSLNVDSDVTRP